MEGFLFGGGEEEKGEVDQWINAFSLYFFQFLSASQTKKTTILDIVWDHT